MHIDDVITDATAVSIAPIRWDRPQEQWEQAAASGVIPKSLFLLYTRSNYLSFGESPRFLREDTNQIFGYYGLLMNSLLGSLKDAEAELSSFKHHYAKVYHPLKDHLGEEWNLEAPGKEKRHFIKLHMNLTASMDLLAELVALFFPKAIKKVTVGRADFQRIADWLSEPPANSSILFSSSTDGLIADLRDSLTPLVLPTGTDKDWLPLMQMIRDKGAHLGAEHFREMGFPDKTGRYYTFIPRTWPLLWEGLIKPKGWTPAKPMNEILIPYMKQDKVSYAEGLRTRVIEVVEAGTSVLAEAYKILNDTEFNSEIQTQLTNNTKTFDFETF